MHKIFHGAVIVHILIVLVIVVGFALGISAFKDHLKIFTPDAGQALYCVEDGMLSATMTIQSSRSYCFRPESTEIFAADTPAVFAFSIVDDEGNTVKNFETVHEKILHLIVVRKDLAFFQHLHPTFDASTGIFTVPDFTLPTTG